MVWFRIDEKKLAIEMFPNDPTGLFHPSFEWHEADPEVDKLGDYWDGFKWVKASLWNIWSEPQFYQQDLLTQLNGTINNIIFNCESNPENNIMYQFEEIELQNKMRDNRIKLGNATENDILLLNYIESVYKVFSDTVTDIKSRETFEDLELFDLSAVIFPEWTAPDQYIPQ